MIPPNFDKNQKRYTSTSTSTTGSIWTPPIVPVLYRERDCNSYGTVAGQRIDIE